MDIVFIHNMSNNLSNEWMNSTISQIKIFKLIERMQMPIKSVKNISPQSSVYYAEIIIIHNHELSDRKGM